MAGPPFSAELPGLNLGCGSWYWDGWTNADVVEQWPGYDHKADVVCDARETLPFEDGQFATVFCGHLIQHLAWRYHEGLMQELHRVIRPGGELIVTEVDMETVLPAFLTLSRGGVLHGRSLDQLQDLIWGEQGKIHGHGLEEADTHRCGFTEHSLRELLAAHAFGTTARVNIHHPDVFYELTLRARRP